MNKCKKCQRDLREGEKDLCPACVSNDDYEIKKWIQIGTGVIGVVGLIVKFFRILK